MHSGKRPFVDALEKRVLLTAELVAEINPASLGSDPSPVVEFAGRAYFTADSPSVGRELWSTDGTAAGTSLVIDLLPGRPGSDPATLTVLGDALFFTATGPDGPGLWRTDGTPAGTSLVTPLTARATSAAVTDGKLFVIESNNLWVTDGTPAGTTQVGSGNASYPIVAMNGLLFYRNADRLFRTDGTAAGTFDLRVFVPVPLAAVNGKLYAAGEGSNHTLTWSNGTPQGTTSVRDFGSLTPGSLIGVGATAYFIADTNGLERLWKTDGTSIGSVALSDPFKPVSGRSTPVAFQGAVYFAGDDAGSGTELWRSDGTAATTRRLADLRPGPESSSPQNLVAVGDLLYFSADDGAGGREPWVTDGTAAGTRRLRDLLPGPGGSRPGPASRALGKSWFAADGGTTGNELFISDGTAAGTTLFADINPTPAGSAPTALATIGDTVFFTADDTALGLGSELWKTDGTASGTVLVKDITPGLAGTRITRATPMGGVLLFVVENQAQQAQLWRSDGTAAGTYLLKQVQTDSYGWEAAPTVSGGKAYFVASRQLWATDGTPAGTAPLDFLPPTSEPPRWLTDVNGILYFSRYDPASGYGVWRTDGTQAGTSLVKSVTPNVNDAPSNLVNVDGTLFFTRTYDLFKSDGTEQGTVELAHDTSFVNVSYAFNLGGTLVLFCRNQTLWNSDGTPEGTVIVGGANEMAEPVVMGNVIYFSAYDNFSSAGRELWRTDGTPGGTRLVKDIYPAEDRQRHSNPTSLTVVGNNLFFTADDGIHGRELWVSDGSEAGTRLAADLAPGAASSNPASLVSAGDTLYFAADSAPHGRELWKIRKDGVAPGVSDRKLFYNHSAFDNNDIAANVADDLAIAPYKRALLPTQVPGPWNVSGYTRGINGIMVDIGALPAGAPLTADDFAFKVGSGPSEEDWQDAPPPTSVTQRPAPGTRGDVTRVTLTWPDGAIKDTWLHVTVKANGRTGLEQPDVFVVGSLVGDTGVSLSAAQAVNALDLAGTRANLLASALVTNFYDFNKDARVNALDLAVVKRNLNHNLTPITETLAALQAAEVPRPSNGRATARPEASRLLDELLL